MSGGLSRTARIAWIVTAIAVVFVVWILAGSATAGLAFFYSVPVGLAAWWFGLRPALLVALASVCLYAIGQR